MAIGAGIFGVSGLAMTEDERSFFKDLNPLGFIVFARNIENPTQLRSLTAEFRDLLGRDDLLVLIDQEGGRVQRLRPPHWRQAPASAIYGRLFQKDRGQAIRAAWLNSRLFAAELMGVGINVNCLPMVDVRTADSNDAVIGDRAYSDDVEAVIALAKAAAAGLIAGGMLPVMKHMPGHGRARVDSHETVPVIDASKEDLTRIDFRPFRALKDFSLGMTGHLVFEALAPGEISTLSPTIINDYIRCEGDEGIGFKGLLLTDDLSMGALQGDFCERTRLALKAGCDIILHCNGDWREMSSVAAELPSLSGESLARAERAVAAFQTPDQFDVEAGLAEFENLVKEFVNV